MNIQEFSLFVQKHSLYPGDLLYNTLGLTGEAGEVANNIKKIGIREYLEKNKMKITDSKTTEEYRQDAIDELGDVLFYLTRVAMDLDSSLFRVIENQRKKIEAQSIKYDKNFQK